MGASLDDSAMIQHHDCLTVPNSGQAVRNDKYRSALHQIVHASLNQSFCSCINGRGCLIQNHNRRICHSSTRNRQQLALTLREIRAITCQHRLITIRQTGDKAVCICQLGSCDTLFIGCIQSAISDVIHDGSRKQIDILQDDAE